MKDRDFKRALELSGNIGCCVEMQKLIERSEVSNMPFCAGIKYSHGYDNVWEINDELRGELKQFILLKMAEYRDEFSKL